VKSIVCVALMIAALTACIADTSLTGGSADDGTKTTERFIPAGDPNLDPSWDWTVSGAGHTIYYTDLIGVVRSKVVQVPFYTGGHPLNTLEKDMYPADGWMLAFRDFGGPSAAPDLPFFALYNKYRGILRIMLYNTRELSYTRFDLELAFKSAAATGALLTYTDNTRAFRDDYDTGKAETYMVEANSINGWICADYMLAGYDPTMNSATQLRLQLRGVDISQVSLASTTFTLSEVLADANPGGGRSSGSLLDAANQGLKYYKSTETAARALRERAASNGSAWWKPILGAIVGTTANPTALASLAPYVGGLIGLVKSFFGGKDDPPPRQPLNFEGSLQMSGTITQSAPLYALDFGVTYAAGDNPPDYYRPVQPIPWGIFNLNTRSTINLAATLICEGTAGDGCFVHEEGTIAQAPSYVFNAAAGLQLVSIEYAIAGEIGPTAFGPWNTVRYIEENWNTGPLSGMAVKLTLKTQAPTLFFDDDLVFYKLYPASVVIH
jgi:hypothetical protein